MEIHFMKVFFEKGLEQLKFLNSLVHRVIFMSTWDKEGSTWNLWSQNCQTSRKVEPFKKKKTEIQRNQLKENSLPTPSNPSFYQYDTGNMMQEEPRMKNETLRFCWGFG